MCPKRFRALEDGPEELVVQEPLVGAAVDHSAAEPERLDGSLQLCG
jgi:hypothetical protein